MLERIILHWSAGKNSPNDVDLSHYHYLIDNFGNVINGKFKPEDNLICKNGYYAMHTKLGNTGSIGISMCGMLGFKNKNLPYKYPITKIQTENCFAFCANLCKKYSILPNSNTIMSHREFNRKHKINTGKIDIIFLPPYPDISQNEIEKFMIDKIKWYLQR